MNNFLITSEYNDNYFIINNGVYVISILSSMLKEYKEDIGDILFPVIENEETRNNLIFIPKSSEIGIALNKLVKEKRIVDASEVISEKHLVNALISQSLCLNNKEYLQDIRDMIRDKVTGSISDLKETYSEETLLAINKEARYVWHFSDRKTKKYYNSMTLTGYEESGIVYQNDNWYYIDIVNDKVILIENENIKLRVRTNKCC